MKKNTDLCVVFFFFLLPSVDLFYADIHDDLTFQLNKPLNNKIVYPFKDKQELFNMFKKF